MRKPAFIFLAALIVAVSAWSQTGSNTLLLVEGGTFVNNKANYYGKQVAVSSFYIGKHEVTQKEWIEVMGYNPSEFKGPQLPVEMVTWYECVEYCNKRSLNEGLEPYYNIDKNQKDPDNRNDNDDVKWTVTVNAGSVGYRLPTETEWEYAAGGGQLSKSYGFSGSDDVEKAAWYWQNSGDTPLAGAWSWPMIQKNHNQTKTVGLKEPNELGLYDMSGNVREWCWDWHQDAAGDRNDTTVGRSGSVRVWRGGGWLGGDFCCASSFRGSFEANGKGSDQGFRICRDSKVAQ